MTVRKQMLDKFQATLEESFAHYCQYHNCPSDNIGYFITYLIDHNLIEPTTIRRYTILKEFSLVYQREEKKKTTTVRKLANRFNISERSVWTIIKEHCQRFEQNSLQRT